MRGKNLKIKGRESLSGAKAARSPKKAKATMQTLIYQELRRSLMAGAFMPGAKVTLRSVSGQIGTSVMPVREAINRLIAERALEVIGDRQVIVPVMTAEKFAEIVYWRVELESNAARAACRHVTPEVIADLESINSRMVEAVERDQRDALLRLNYEFHFRIYHAAGSAILLPMIESLWLQISPYFNLLQGSGNYVSANSSHRIAAEALGQGDAASAKAAIRADIDRARSMS